MAVKKVVIWECDRCGKKEEIVGVDGVEKTRSALAINFYNPETDQEKTKTFNDLCKVCRKRVKDLVSVLLLEDQPKKEKKEKKS